ncbi:MAG: hypothetical protein SCALA702_06640 [Melioribacteraceae bacterium]|nr:MAG: hypothetical protein SCALA702_06640 [Melioribacteraceae bacterium]
MINSKQQLLIEQVDRKLQKLKEIEDLSIPSGGWIRNIRIALKMSLRQLGKRLNISPQSAREIEIREADGGITLKTLRNVAEALDMKFVYGFIPKSENIETMIEKRAAEIAKTIVARTSASMILEDQAIPYDRVENAVKLKSQEIKDKMPSYLWD